MTHFSIKLCLLSFLAILFLCLNLGNGLVKAASENNDYPIIIEGDSLTVDRNKNQLSYKGNVKVIYKDIVIVCKKLNAYYNLSKQTLAKIVAIGDTKIIYKNMVATCGMAILYPSTKQLLLKKNPMLYKGKSSINGNQMLLDYSSNKVHINGSSQKKVQVTLFQNDKFSF